MGRRGPVPEPSAIKELNGTMRMFSAEPKPRPTRPACPQYLSALARKEWRRIVPELERLGLLTCVDGTALEAYCSAYANMVQAQMVINRDGLTFETPNGYVQQRPEVAIVNKCSLVIRQFCIEFGLTPSARARMDVGDGWRDSNGDPMEAILTGGGRAA